MQACNLSVIVLAAGNSTRLGQPKQCVSYNGERLINKQCELALTVSHNVYTVLGYKAHAILSTVAKPIREQVRFVNNTAWQQGMSSSISRGVSALKDDTDAVLILLVDQWQLNTGELVSLVEKWRENPTSIVTAAHNSQSTPPVIFPKRYFSELVALGEQSGDGKKRGAISVVKKHQENTHFIEIPAAFVDLDTPEQLQFMRQSAQA